MTFENRLARLESLVANLPGMAYRCLHDADWTLEFVSNGCLDLLGYSVEQLVSERVVAMADLIHADDLERVSLAVEKALTARASFTCEYRVRVADGRIKWVWEQGNGVFSEDGDLMALQGFLLDVTDRVASENALRELQKLDAMGDLATSVAHDFNNLLTVVHASTGMLRLDPRSSDKQLRDVAAIEDAAVRASKLVQQLLALGRSPLADTPVININQSIIGMRDILDRITGDDVAVEITLAPLPARVAIDRTQFEQVIINLVVNARDAMRAGGRLEVTTQIVPLTPGSHEPRRVGAGEVRLDVVDNGEGIHAHHIDSLFKPLFTTKAPGKGTGLGLAIVHSLVKRSGGDVTVESALGQGTRFTISWPLSVDLDSAEPQPSGPGEPVILFAEDDDLVRTTMARGLRSLGFVVLEAQNGQQALHISARHKGRLHALVTDLRMPKLDGAALADGLRESRPGTPTILVTGSNVDPEELARFDRVVQKPTTPDYLAQVLRTLLRE